MTGKIYPAGVHVFIADFRTARQPENSDAEKRIAPRLLHLSFRRFTPTKI